jgi:hypothetical protein
MSEEKEITNLFATYSTYYWETNIVAYNNLKVYKKYYEDDNVYTD